MTVDGTERSSATAAPTSLTFAHTTRDTVKTVGLSVPTATLSQEAWPQYGSGRDYSEGPVYLAFRAALLLSAASEFGAHQRPMSVYQPAVAEHMPRVDTLRRLESRLQPVGRTTLRGTGKLRRRMSPAHQFRLTLRQRAAAAGEPGCWLKDREPEKPRSRNCHEPRLSRQGVFIHGRKELR